MNIGAFLVLAKVAEKLPSLISGAQALEKFVPTKTLDVLAYEAKVSTVAESGTNWGITDLPFQPPPVLFELGVTKEIGRVGLKPKGL